MWIIKILEWDIGGLEWTELYRTEYPGLAFNQLRFYTAEMSTFDIVMVYEDH